MNKGSTQTTENRKNQTSTEELIKQLENRLDWLTNQPADDINPEEIDNILSLLDRLKPLPEQQNLNPEEAFDRFEREYLNNPDRLEEAHDEAERMDFIRELSEREDRETKSDTEGTPTATRRHRRRLHILKNVGIAAAVMILVFTGLNIATYATAKKGLFDFIINRKNTMSNMYIGDEGMGMDYEIHEKEIYTSWDDVPDDVKEGILLPSYLPEGMELEEVEVFGNEPLRIELMYNKTLESEKYLHIAIRQYDEKKVKNQIAYPKAEYVENKKIGDRECFYYKDQTENILIFIEENYIYYFYSNISEQELKKIIESI